MLTSIHIDFNFIYTEFTARWLVGTWAENHCSGLIRSVIGS